MKFKKTFTIFFLNIILLNLSLIYATNIQKNNNKYLRIHIVANSDSIDDQLLKYTMAKHVNNYIAEITKLSQSKEESKIAVEENIPNILTLCNKIICEENFNYSVKAYFGKMRYDEKSMDNIQMKAGSYDSLKIVIENGQGQNWWSLIYPTAINNCEQLNFFEQDVTYSLGIFELFQNMFKK